MDQVRPPRVLTETSEEPLGGEACLAGWMPGQDTLKPGPGLVGKAWEVWKPKKS